MLQFPTNIYPQNVAFDPNVADSKCALHFVFNGDILTTASFKIYNYATGALVSTSYYAPNDRVAWHYNGDQVGFADGTLGSGLSSGNDYVIQMMLTQSTADGSNNIYDMPIVRGEIQANSTAGESTSLYLKDGIANIYEWGESGGVCTPTTLNNYIAAGAVIQIGTETRFINSYNRTTGKLVVDSAFTNLPIKGDSYIIFANYLVTPQYYFMCRTTPTVTTSVTVGAYTGHSHDTITATTTYSQAQRSMIKYYNYELYWYNSELTASDVYWRHLKTSSNIYSQKVDWRFIRQLIGVNNIDGTISTLGTTWYKVVCNVTTQEGMTVQSNTIFSVAPNNSSEAFVIDGFVAEIMNDDMPDYIEYADKKVHQTIRIKAQYSTRPDYSDFHISVYRHDLETKATAYLGEAKVQTIDGVNYMVYYDYAVPNKGKFKYIYVPRDTSGQPYINAISETTIDVDMLGYTITALDEHYSEYDYTAYDIGQCWKFVGEISDSTVTQNIDRMIHVGQGRYSSATSIGVNYATGTLSAMIGSVDCADKKYKDTIDMINAWREFITQHKVFMLKSQKGDVWIVNITDSPTVSYQESYKTIPTTFSFSWAECCSIDNVILLQP